VKAEGTNIASNSPSPRVQLGEAHIVANRKREPAEGAFDRHGPISGLHGARLVIAFGLILESEQVHLVVARDAPAGVVVDQASAAHALSIAR
jgi:hypothetical protein